MYEIYFSENRGTYYIIVQNNKIHFDTEEQAFKFILMLLKDTGRIGY